MKPTNLTSIDFQEIRESIKSYMRTRPEFTDYDFTGSTLSYLLDVLAYNTYYSAFNANMALNELFLDTATIRDNVASLARFANYLPRSVTSAKACLTVNVQTLLNQRQEYPGYVTLKAGPVASGSVNGISYSFVILDDYTVRVNRADGTAVFPNFKVYEGDLLEYQYVVDTTINQKYIIPNDNVDTDTIKVFVKPNIQSTQYDRFNVVQNITNVDSESRVFFLSEYEDRRYEVTFGDGVIGKKLEDNQVVIIQYVRSSGADANNINFMSFIGNVVDSDGLTISPQLIDLTLNEKSQLGDAAETLKSIKFNAPRYYAAQNRAVTSNDYESIVRSIYPNAKYVNAYGGETLTPAVYGKVFISIKTKTGTKLNNLTKKDIISKLKPYSMASIEVVIEDPDEFFVDLNIFVTANTFKSSLGSDTLSQNTSDDIRRKILAAIKNYGDQEDLGNFNKKLSLSQLQKVILEADPNINDAQYQVTPYKKIAYPLDNSEAPRTYTMNFGVELNCSCASSVGSTVKSSAFYNNLYPNIPQYIEDDGSGTLKSYYIDNNKKVYTNNNVGNYDCNTGKVNLGPIVITTPSSVGVPSDVIISINPLNPDGLDPSANTPGTILSIGTPNIEVSTSIPSGFAGGTVGDPNTLSTNPPTILEFVSPSTSTSGLSQSCFL